MKNINDLKLRELLPSLSNDWVDLCNELDMLDDPSINPVVYSMVRALKPETVVSLGEQSVSVLRAFQLNGSGHLYSLDLPEERPQWPGVEEVEGPNLPPHELFVDLSPLSAEQALPFWRESWNTACKYMILEDILYSNRRYAGVGHPEYSGFQEFFEGREADVWHFGSLIVVKRILK